MGDATFVDTTSLEYSRAQPRAKLKLTKAQRRALMVLRYRHRQGRSALTSQATDVVEGHVNANAAASLIAAGLATTTTGLPGCRYVRITQAGLDHLAAENGGA